ncbi:hypothetical protein SCLCIDRAFT_1224215, partial [Scleroderma citrinum Foug A]
MPCSENLKTTIGDARWAANKLNGRGNPTNASNAHMDAHGIGNRMEMTENVTTDVRTSSKEVEVESHVCSRNRAFGPTDRWRRVGIGVVDAFLLLDAPIEDLGMV